MTKEEAIKLANDNIQLIDKKVEFNGTAYILKRLLIDQIGRDDYKVKVSL